MDHVDIGFVSVVFSRVLGPDNTSWAAWLLGIGVRAGAFGLCALVLRRASKATDFLWALAFIWRPIVLVIAAGYLLFSNDEGRELGIGLMTEDNG